MKWLYVILHLLGGAWCIFIGLTIISDYWKTPAYITLIVAIIMLAIGIGILSEKRWVRWLIILLIITMTPLAMLMLAGAVLWPESLTFAIMLIYGVLIAIEIATFHYTGRFKKHGQPSC